MTTNNREEQAHHEKTVTKIFAYKYSGLKKYPAPTDLCYPDQEERKNKAIDLLAKLGDKTIAIEHTRLLPWKDKKYDDQFFNALVSNLENDIFNSIKPGIQIDVLLQHSEIPKLQSDSPIIEKFHAWLKSIVSNLEIGRHDKEFRWGNLEQDVLHVCFYAEETDPDSCEKRLFFMRTRPDETPPVEQRLNAKLEKLCSTKADIHILLLEKETPAFSSNQIRQEISRFEQWPTNTPISLEIWMITTIENLPENWTIALTWSTDEQNSYHVNPGSDTEH